MLETICKQCGQRYPLGTDHVCPKPVSKKSTASGKDRTPGAQVNVNSRPLGSGAELAAGTQALPVDTRKTKPGRPLDVGPSKGKSPRAAYMRDYQRRSRKKAK